MKGEGTRFQIPGSRGSVDRRYEMAIATHRESFRVEGAELLERFKALVHEGNIRRIVIKQGEQTVVEFPLTIGIVGAAVAPMVAAVGALAALVTDCTIEVERAPEVPQTASPDGHAESDA
jgi:hypothetical protein